MQPSETLRAVILAVTIALGALAALPAAADLASARAALMRGDYATALPEIRALAEAGAPEAQTLLGDLHVRGDGVEQDYAQAANWYERAAYQGYADAQYLLAELYLSGKGVPQDNAAAYMWLWLAFETGSERFWQEERDRVMNKISIEQQLAAEATAREIMAHYPADAKTQAGAR